MFNVDQVMDIPYDNISILHKKYEYEWWICYNGNTN